ncbi:hypothetical protein DVA67_026465 [Solirubrobacter sp. CPCC 204708]|uniref:EfeO-type cupredoxin-like domain-containing protein n=1 Tax=Solirubrobacter deserti TaxID=2282478 RepID=A0ABT4RF68_9ACTN|nr:hypothetical protein [Solirubrobacter deserti]MBE2319539.1 hypothetical protein [Solirubrobacter deserti]MDA0137174.1 hypothetical protein [Solirubrobacter deserti]
MRRRLLLTVTLVTAAAGCGDDTQRVNELRPAPQVNLTAAVQDDVIRVSPRSVGAGQLVLIISNQSDQPQRVTFRTDELGGSQGGRTATSPLIPAKSTGRLKIDAREGRYSVSVADDAIQAARVFVGPPRESGQDRVLLP